MQLGTQVENGREKYIAETLATVRCFHSPASRSQLQSGILVRRWKGFDPK
jgi:hypothetical protein